MSVLERMGRPGPKRLLAIDGGGIRGVIAIELLAAIEAALRDRLGAGPSWVLADWFDYIGGTSTGAIIATLLSLGHPVSAVRGFYQSHGAAIFGPARLLRRLRHRFEGEPLAQALRSVFGAQRTLGSDDLRTLLMVTLRNATTDSPWPLSSNPRARFNDRGLADCNLELPLWQIVRASTAAPTYFPPEVVQVGPRRFVFEDGGVTPYNNPAFLLFLMATAAPYRLGWATGAEALLLVSVGTGSVPSGRLTDAPTVFDAMLTVPRAMAFAAMNHQDMLCRMFGDTIAGPPLDEELGDLSGGSGLPKLFTYVRYNAELSRRGLDAAGLGQVRPADVQRMEAVRHMPSMAALGRAVAAEQVRGAHFDRHIG